MIPLHSTPPRRRVPWVNYALIGTNTALFVYELTLGAELTPFIRTHGWVPVHFSLAMEQGTVPVLMPLFLSMFLHGNWLHLLGNMLFLSFFGGRVEERLGHCRYLGFYIIGGAVAVFVQTYTMPFSARPMIGASGAVAAVVGVYCIFFATTREESTSSLLISRRVALPVVGCIFLWLVLQLGASVAASLEDGEGFARSAWWAHLGGFMAGIAYGSVYLRKRRRRSSRSQSQSPLVWSDL